MHILERTRFDELVQALVGQGYEVVGPFRRGNAIEYGPVSGAGDLPIGWEDDQAPGSYSLRKAKHEQLFAYVVGPHSWKKYLFPPQTTLLQAERKNGHLQFHVPPKKAPKYALLGVRACELNAIRIQDQVFLDSQHPDPTYAERRNNAFIVAVNCGRAGGTCFCDSMGTGPSVSSGYDLALTEILTKDRHFFAVESGAKKGKKVLDALDLPEASEEEKEQAAAAPERARKQMGRTLDTNGLRELLAANAESPHWEEVAKRCLDCANCTMSCPTCFCSTVYDGSAVNGQSADRVRVWDSCFTTEFSYIHGGSVRKSTVSRYRQWMTHKLSTWHDQYGTSGCVGCGRCITWCPAGIDITEEARALRAKHAQPSK